MPVVILRTGSLVLYKSKPARVEEVSGDKLEISTPSGRVRVRPKDVVELHPGPVANLDVSIPSGDPRDAWDLVEGETFSLADLADLAFGSFTPGAALGVWNWLQDGTYFEGGVDGVKPKSPGAVQATLDAREAKDREAREWDDFIAALKRRDVTDARKLADVESLASGRTSKSRVLTALGRLETPQEAHALLLDLGVWTETRNPHPERAGVSTKDVALPFPTAPSEDRLDLTHLSALAIDDEGSADPDDALSIERTDEGWRLWVHVADPAVIVTPDSELDREARTRGATLYLPDRTITMLPQELTDAVALGLTETSNALSVALDLNDAFEVTNVDVHLTRLHVTRLTYAEAQERLHEPTLAALAEFGRAARSRREAAGALMLRLPEVRIRVRDGDVRITSLPPFESRLLVQEAMMAAGEGVARWAAEREIALPFAAQDRPLGSVEGDDLASQYAGRKLLARTRFAPSPAPHFGLGLSMYAQSTSPLRRYLDLVVHQQVRAFLAGERLLSGREISARTAEADMAAGAVRSAERASNRHWTLVFLRRHAAWRGEGVVVERKGASATVLLPDLALDATVTAPHDLGETVTLEVASVDLPNLTARWRVLT
ncbi:RNB domain-containing ribonuclease [Deinococcus yavapaiensis]|uniref:Exoribonuclease-2 n=1 Tax=Deinococcus yavapaiensis KR-236 TaxID=694435 RepID=A0A318S4F4_9DEIO|nr:RNB domain-containing ribonuclease [Deinococcus yavapaiensis]PYE50022.1 exoribonuclease-2 [Deinococcus yavapaiensis KR-236]